VIQPISQNNINFSYKKINNGVNQLNAVRLSNDNVSFTSQSQFVSAPVLKMLQQLDVEQPVLGFKGNGKWLLPNLLKVAGQRFNLYMPDGSQLTYQKGAWNDNVLFTLKLNKINEKVSSKIKLRDVDEHLEHKKLRKTKSDKILMFRVNTKDSVHGKYAYKAGEISKIIKDSDGAILEYVGLTSEEAKRINSLLEKHLPDFF